MHQNTYVQQYQQSMMQQHPQMHQQMQMVQMEKRSIAPAPLQPIVENNQQNRVTSTVSASKKAKMSYSHMEYAPVQSVSVQRRNARERNRVKQVNNGFTTLRHHIPTEVITDLSNGGRGASKKLSKVDTLRLAVEYIRRLQGVLDDSDDALSTSSSTPSSSASNNSYYSPSPVQYSTNQPSQSYTESLPSPTPSFISDNSSVENASYVMPTTYNYEQTIPVQHSDEEDILDAISWWQQQ